MANRTYLMAHSSECATTAELAEDACLLGANYQVPILWIALFDSSDLAYVDVPCTDSEGRELIERTVGRLRATHSEIGGGWRRVR